MIVVEVLFPGLFIAAGVILLAAGGTVDARSAGLALLLPGAALGIGAVIRLLGIFHARADFLTDRRVASIKRARRLDMVGLGIGIVLSVIALMVIAFTSWVTEIGGVIAVAVALLAMFITLLDSLVGFLGARTGLRATADQVSR
jgi:hypothetical protein